MLECALEAFKLSDQDGQYTIRLSTNADGPGTVPAAEDLLYRVADLLSGYLCDIDVLIVLVFYNFATSQMQCFDSNDRRQWQGMRQKIVKLNDQGQVPYSECSTVVSSPNPSPWSLGGAMRCQPMQSMRLLPTQE